MEINNNKYVPRSVVLEKLGIHYQTLYNMIDRDEIEYIEIGRKYYYNLNKYLKDRGINVKPDKKKQKICYCRVSSYKQKADLDRQIKYMKDLYPTHKIIKDIGSGLNFNRKGLNLIIELAIEGKIDELVIAHKDRLARFGFEMIENLIEKYSGGKIKILDKTKEETPTEEITKDIISIMNIYVARINGLRNYNSKIKKTIENTK